jgi:hypothetical protein
MRLLASALMIVALAPVSHVTMSAADSKVLLPLTLVDNGEFTFTSQTSALVNGDGFEKQGFGRNIPIGSSGQFDLLGPADKCANGYTGRLAGVATEPDGSRFSYTIDNQLCPTGVPNVYAASGTYKITGGTGKYKNVKGTGLFEGLADFALAKYKCLLFGTVSY